MYDYGCYASRTVYVLGKAVEECTRRLLELGRKTAAAMFQCMESAVKYQDGEFYLETEPSKRGDLRQVSEYALSVQGKDIYQVCTVNSRKSRYSGSSFHYGPGRYLYRSREGAELPVCS